MNLSVTPRQFAAVLGGLLLAAGVIAILFAPVSANYDTSLFGEQSVDCGTAVVPDIDLYSGDPLAVCRDALGSRRAWGWPVTVAGAVLLVGALLVRAPARPPIRESEES